MCFTVISTSTGKKMSTRSTITELLPTLAMAGQLDFYAPRLNDPTKKETQFYTNPYYIAGLLSQGKGDPTEWKKRKNELAQCSRAYYFCKQTTSKPIDMRYDVKRYLAHRERVLFPEKKVDNNPPRLHPRIPRTERGAWRLDDIMLENKLLLEKICLIWRGKGATDTTCPKVYWYSKFRQRMWDMARIEAHNVHLLYHIQNARALVPTREECAAFRNMCVGKMRFICRYPFNFTNCSNLDQPLPMSNPPPVDPDPLPRRRVYMDFVTSQERILGRLEIELFEEEAPATCQNFLAYIFGTENTAQDTTKDGKDIEKGKAEEEGVSEILCYRHTPLHRILPGYYILGGDVNKCNGTGGVSIAGGPMADEKNDLEHIEAGLLCTIGSKPNDVDSKFMITLKPIPSLDGKSTVFGRVVKGVEVLWALNSLGAKGSGKPIIDVYCADCNEIKRPIPRRPKRSTEGSENTKRSQKGRDKTNSSNIKHKNRREKVRCTSENCVDWDAR